ncbi:MAG: hypothetical protein L6414_06205, partial [Hydrogenophaga sp.]|nr:hypothetical protein [Hydrogenophaga sp.]
MKALQDEQAAGPQAGGQAPGRAPAGGGGAVGAGPPPGRARRRGRRPGGLLILESFHPQQLQHRSGGPKDVSMLYTPAPLRDDFAGL